jgi:hypothetical protein
MRRLDGPTLTILALAALGWLFVALDFGFDLYSQRRLDADIARARQAQVWAAAEYQKHLEEDASGRD